MTRYPSIRRDHASPAQYVIPAIRRLQIRHLKGEAASPSTETPMQVLKCEPAGGLETLTHVTPVRLALLRVLGPVTEFFSPCAAFLASFCGTPVHISGQESFGNSLTVPLGFLANSIVFLALHDLRPEFQNKRLLGSRKLRAFVASALSGSAGKKWRDFLMVFITTGRACDQTRTTTIYGRIQAVGGSLD